MLNAEKANFFVLPVIRETVQIVTREWQAKQGKQSESIQMEWCVGLCVYKLRVFMSKSLHVRAHVFNCFILF